MYSAVVARGYLHSSPPFGVSYVNRESRRRLVKHVADIDALGAAQRHLDALGIGSFDAPF